MPADLLSPPPIFTPLAGFRYFEELRKPWTSLYVGKQAVKFNIPETEAVERLIDLIREHDKWIDAPVAS